MRDIATRNARALLSGHTVVRILIVSYFIALALYIIPGTDMSVLLQPFLPTLWAAVLTSSAVIVLSIMIIAGFHRRAAALLLALGTFWASYMTMLNAPVNELGAFWRDLALIGALIMTYADGANDKGSSDAAGSIVESRARSLAQSTMATARSVISRPEGRTRSQERAAVTELYREDLARAR